MGRERACWGKAAEEGRKGKERRTESLRFVGVWSEALLKRLDILTDVADLRSIDSSLRRKRGRGKVGKETYEPPDRTSVSSALLVRQHLLPDGDEAVRRRFLRDEHHVELGNIVDGRCLFHLDARTEEEVDVAGLEDAWVGQKWPVSSKYRGKRRKCTYRASSPPLPR